MSKVENRTADIRRTAEEIRLQFLNDHAGDGSKQFFQMLWRALVNPNLSSTDKVIYTLALAERKNFEWSNDRMGKLANVSEVTVKRSFANLETHGFVVSRYRGTGSTAHRDFPMPEIVAVAREVEKKLRRKPAKKPAQGQPFENPEWSKMTVLNGQKRPTTSKDSTSEDSKPYSCGLSYRGAKVKKKMDALAQLQVGYSQRARIEGKDAL